MSAPFVTVGVVFQQRGWHVTPRTRTFDGRMSLHVALVFASQVFHIDHVATIGACRGVISMPALKQYNPGKS